MSAEKYVSPLSQRYASSDMQKLFSEAHRARLWRQLWVILAQTEHDLGLPVSQEQVDELRSHTDDVDLERCHEYEAAVRHDVMAHIKAYADVCPKAAPIIHLGATSCYVGCDPPAAGSYRACAAESLGIRQGLGRTSDAGVYAFSARSANDCRQTRHAVDAGPGIRP